MTETQAAEQTTETAERSREEWCSEDRVGFFGHLRELWRFRDLLWALSMRAIKARYKQSVLGVGWAIIQPFAMMVIFTIIFSKFAKVDTGDTPYAVFSYAALLPWQLFSTSVTRGGTSIADNGSIVKKIYFPREVCPVSAVGAALVDFAVASVMLVLLMLFYHVGISALALLLPVVLIIQLMLTFGIIFFLSAVNAFYRDIGFGLPLVLQIWMYASPVVYPISLVPERYQQLYMLNPMTPVIDSFRRVLVEDQMPHWNYLGIAAGVAFVCMIIGYSYFKRAEGLFADVL